MRSGGRRRQPVSTSLQCSQAPRTQQYAQHTGTAEQTAGPDQRERSPSASELPRDREAQSSIPPSAGFEDWLFIRYCVGNFQRIIAGLLIIVATLRTFYHFHFSDKTEDSRDGRACHTANQWGLELGTSRPRTVCSSMCGPQNTWEMILLAKLLLPDPT